MLRTEIAGVRITAPMMNIHTVAAGGGSILSFDGARMRVGPESAGADPGPAAYGRGGPLAVTDANVVTGRLRPEFFPAIFGPAGDRPLDVGGDAGGVRASWRRRSGRPAEAVAEGFLRIAVENMANAIKKISVQRGYDVSGYCLTVFGGAGAQHACAIADTLGMEACLIHPMASLLVGLRHGARRHPGDADAGGGGGARRGGPAGGGGAARRAGVGRARRRSRRRGWRRAECGCARSLLLKVKGTDTALPVAFGEARGDAGGVRGGAPGAVRLRSRRGGAGRSRRRRPRRWARRRTSTEAAVAEAERPEAEIEAALVAPVCLGGGWVEARFVRREAMAPGDRLSGPAVLVEPHTSILVEPGWQARVTGHDHVELRAGGGAAAAGGGGDAGRPGDARGLQQPLHVDRRADGGGAGEHRGQRDDQGAAGLLLRGVRRGGAI